MILRVYVTRLLLLALAWVLLLGVLAGTASADEYGGLGPLGTFKAGRNGGHLEVYPRSHHAFGVAPDGSSYIAETLEAGGESYFRIQKLGSQGEYLAEAKVKLAGPAHQLDGVAIDAEEQRLYLLVVNERNPEEETPVFDPEAPVAAALYAFSTEPKEGELEPAAGTTAGLLAGEKTLSSLSEEGGVPLLDPHGIAVDPTTHDVLILGQQDISGKKGFIEPENLRAAVQRVHTEGPTEGELGPRYVDEANCLDEGSPSKEEIEESQKPCAEGFGQPSSPFVSPGGRFYGERLSEAGSGELWELPATENDSEAFESHPKVYETKPRRLFTMGHEAGIVEPFTEEEGAGGALAFEPTGPGEGKIYLDAEITAEEGNENESKNHGAVVLDFSENGETPKAREFGWTAGQNETSSEESCVVPSGASQTLVGIESDGRMSLFDVTTANAEKHQPAKVSILQFGAGGDECGHARATPPSVLVKGQPVITLKAGQNASLSLDVFAADTNNVEWKFLCNGKEQADEPPVLGTYPFPTQVPTLTHEFKHGGSYEIVAAVEPDDFGPKIEEHSDVTVEGEEGGSGGVAIGTEFSYTSPATVDQPAKFAAKVTDPNNRALPGAQYRYVWEFGDGVRAEGSGDREFKAEHVYASEGRYDVKLTVIDEAGRSTEATHTVQVNVPPTPAGASSSVSGGGGGSGGSGASGGGGAPASPPVPDATLTRTSLVVSGSGGVTLRVACPAGEASCSGTVTLRTLGAIAASAHAKKRVLTLATGSFTVVGGRITAVTLRLSAKARALLARSHLLRARTTLQAHDPAGATHTTQAIVTLRFAKSSRKRKH